MGILFMIKQLENVLALLFDLVI